MNNNFDCVSCNKNNSVYMNITTAQTTSPLDLNALTVSTYIQEKEDAIDRIQDE